MPDAEPVARGPVDPGPSTRVVDGWVVRAAAPAGARPGGARHTAGEALTLVDCTPVTKVLLRADPDGAATDLLEAPRGRAVRRRWTLGSAEHDVLVVGQAPGEWLVLAPPATGGAVVERLQAVTEPLEELVTVIDLTHARALLRLTGPRVPSLLAKECGADLRPDRFPDGAAGRSGVAGVATDLIRSDAHDPDGARPSYLLHCEWMSGQHLVSSLLDAGEEFGLEPTGFQPPGV